MDTLNEGLRSSGYEEDMINEISVWPYAIYYPYYEQYTTIFSEALIQGSFHYREFESHSPVISAVNLRLNKQRLILSEQNENSKSYRFV